MEDCTNLEGIEAFRRSGFDNSIIPQCTWRQLNTPAAGGPIAGVDGVLLNDVQPVTSNVRQFFAEVAAKSTLLLGGFTAGELAANQLNLSVSLVNYKPEEFATTPLTGKDAEAIAVYLDLRSEFPEALRFESPTTGQELQVETSSGSSGAGQLVQLAFEPSTLEFSASVRPNGRSTFKVGMTTSPEGKKGISHGCRNTEGRKDWCEAGHRKCRQTFSSK